jgi:transposase-like protein
MAKRRTFTAEFKTQVVLEVISGVKSSAEICREHNLKPQLLSRWKAEFLDNAPKVFEADERRRYLSSQVQSVIQRITGLLSWSDW